MRWCIAVIVGTVLGFVVYKPSPAGEPPAGGKVVNRWALLIGVDDYLWARKLEYCGADMRALGEQLVTAGFLKEHVYMLHDKATENKNRPTKASIEAHLRLILGLVEPDDLLVVGFSGHGVHLNGKSYLCPAETRLDDPNTLITVDTIYDQLQKCPAALKLFVMDACRNDPRPGGERSLAPTEGSRQFAQSLERPPQGILMLNSCAPNEIAREDKEFGHGVFMHFLLEGLRGAADVNHNGRVSLMELYLYTNDKTKSYVAQKFVESQRPSLKGDLHDNFDLALVNPVRNESTESARMSPAHSDEAATEDASPVLERPRPFTLQESVTDAASGTTISIAAGGAELVATNRDGKMIWKNTLQDETAKGIRIQRGLVVAALGNSAYIIYDLTTGKTMGTWK